MSGNDCLQGHVAGIFYDVFASDIAWLEQCTDEYHEIDREIRFEFSNQKRVFVSWCSTPVQYSVGLQLQSFFSDSQDVLTRDMTHDSLWSDLIGELVEFNFVDAEHQVLEIRSGASAVYCCSRELRAGGVEDWRSDAIHITRKRPPIVAKSDSV